TQAQIRNSDGPIVPGSSAYARVYVPSASGSDAKRHRSAKNIPVAATAIARYVFEKRAAAGRSPAENHSMATQPAATGMRTTVVSFVAQASTSAAAASVTSAARRLHRGSLADAAAASSDAPIHAICSGSAFDSV